MSTAASKSIQDIIIEAKPWITSILILYLFWSFYELSGHGLIWVKDHAFSGGKFIYQLQHGAYAKMLEMMFWSTFAQVNIWQFLGNAYFVWVFGSTLEARLGGLRFSLLVLASIFVGWYLLGINIGTKSSSLFVGPGLLTTGIIGGYLILFPEKKINPRGNLDHSYRIFKNEPTPNPAESFGISPWFIMLAFVVFEVAMHFILGKMSIRFDVLQILPALGTMILGSVITFLMVAISTKSYEGNPLRRLAIQRYKQLRALDLGHEEAIKGSARILAIPPEQIEQWVAKGSSAILSGPAPPQA